MWIEGDVDITIRDAGQWEDLPGVSEGLFRGELSSEAYRRGVDFTVTWFNENGKKLSGGITPSTEHHRASQAVLGVARLAPISFGTLAVYYVECVSMGMGQT